MRFLTSAIFVLLVAQQAAACDICEWGQALGLPSCSNACNQCNDQQQSGLDFGSCPLGALSSFGGLEFSGCSVGNWGSMLKREFVPRGSSKRNLGALGSLFGLGGGSSSEASASASAGSQCAMGQISRSSGPSFSCGAGTSPFSVSQMQVSVDQDTPVLFTYHYDSGSNTGQTCTQTAQCLAGAPNTVQNTQCGGASRVQCSLPPESSVQSCNLGIYSVGFDCSTCSGGSPSPPAAAPSTPLAPSSPPVVPPPAAPSSLPVLLPLAVPSPPVLPPPAVLSPPAPPVIPSSPAPPPTPVPSPPPNSTTPRLSPSPSPPTLSSSFSSLTTANSSVSAPSTLQSTTAQSTTQPIITPQNTTSQSATSQSTITPSISPRSTTTQSSTTSSITQVASTGSTPPSPSAKTYSNATIPIVQSTVPVITSEVVYTTVTSCSQTIAHTKGSYTSFDIVPTMSTVIITSTKTFCTRCVAPPMTESPPTIQSTVVSTGGPSSAGQASVRTITSSAPVELATSSSSPPTSAPASPAQAAPAPNLLPNCIQTWIKYTNCKDNSDAGCFCKDSNFTSNVQQCISAWSSHAAEEQGALSYLAGICAAQIPSNPGIVTNVPKTITLAPMPVPTNSPNPATPITAGATQQATSSPPQTTVSISTTVTIPCPSSGATSIVNQISDGHTQIMCMTTSVLITAVAVPQVAFITSNSAVGLIAGTPAPNAAVTTAVNLPVASAVAAPPISPAVAPAITLAATPASGFASGSGTSFTGPISTGIVPFTGEGFKLAARSFVKYLALLGFLLL